MTPKDRAHAIVDRADAMEDIIHREVGRLMADGVESVIEAIWPLKEPLRDHPIQHRAVERTLNSLTAIKAGYANGSLPRKGANSPSQSRPELDR